jgi:hypothetical protein
MREEGEQQYGRRTLIGQRHYQYDIPYKPNKPWNLAKGNDYSFSWVRLILLLPTEIGGN